MTNPRVKQLFEAAPAILPSLLQCDFGNLEREVRRLEDDGCQGLHLDVMDGVFVPNISYGMPIVDAIRKLTDLPLDVHLMIQDPGKYAQAFSDAGADLLTFHVEAVDEIAPVIDNVRSLNMGTGLVLNPGTAIDAVTPFLDQIDVVLVMSVDAGFGGQAFNPVAIDKLKALRAIKPDLILEIDGGVNLETIGSCREAGADLFVVGSAIFRSSDYAAALERLRAEVQRHDPHSS
ncbi:ribulose-phosphate 3-epimerase [Rosistilla oblonga]|uniref:ribulose-phosphate 3-epimerase n=1 Tax=Rosistilla oblonga TaxID=2527990 RepID=UPI003A96E148